MKKLVAGATTAIVLTAMLITAAVRTGGSAAADTPEACLEHMFQAMKTGDVRAYLNCFTGELLEQLRRSTAEQTTAGFASYLEETVKPIRGRAVFKSEMSGDNQARLVVDRVYEARQWEYQAYRLRRESGTWKIYAIEPVELHDPPVPYGTPAFPEAEKADETSNSGPGGR